MFFVLYTRKKNEKRMWNIYIIYAHFNKGSDGIGRHK